jgi:hypothetical protein
MPLPEIYQPSQIAKRLGTSERRVRAQARKIGACLVVGKNRIVLTDIHVSRLMESFECRSRSTGGAKSGTSGARLPDASYEKVREQLSRKSPSKLRTASKPASGNVVSMALKPF